MRTHVSLSREMAESLAASDIETVVRVCGSRLWYMAMKVEQIEAITRLKILQFIVLVLTTGYGKFLVYIHSATTCI